MERPVPHLVDRLPDATEVTFLKPGKEAFREKNPKPHDMRPVVPGYEAAAFRDVWSLMARVAFADLEAFKVLAVLVYRSAYHLDHVVVDRRVRYHPAGPVAECINLVDGRIGTLLPDGGVWALLHFLDILGWNEDVKYHSEEDRATFDGDFGFPVGRVNTLLTCIRVPYEVARLARHVAENAASPERIRFEDILSVMQQFANAKGTAAASKRQLLAWLSPYLRP